MIAYTPALGIAYCDPDTALADFPTATQQAATTVETALKTRGLVTADVSDLIAAGWFADTGQINITTTNGLAAGWAVGSQGARYRKVGRWVYVMLHLTATAAYSASAIPFVLPAGFRPGSRHYFQANIGGPGSINTAGSIAIDTAGANGAAVTMSTAFPVA